jgi:LDH2 family malate/lactate/ureidoglycolate dehydrogenase
VTLTAEALRDFVRRLLESVGVTRETAEFTAESLVSANLRGVDSHGVQLLPYYIEGIETGDVDPHTTGRVISESGACLQYEGCNGLGQMIAAQCCDHAVRLASQFGLGMVAARNSSHFGAAAFWGQRISAAGMIGIVTCDASPLVPPWQGKEPRLGTNPICVSVPGGAWLLDMATTTVAAGKIFKHAINGDPVIPAGWAMDSEGVPTTDTAQAMKGLLMPLGGYKGSGLAMLTEILGGVLSGGAMSTEVAGPRTRGRPSRINQTFIAIDVSRFMPVEQFEERMNKLAAMVKSAPPALGYTEVLVAGEPERRIEEQRLCSGIPLVPGVWESLVRVGQRRGVALPPGIE